MIATLAQSYGLRQFYFNVIETLLFFIAYFYTKFETKIK